MITIDIVRGHVSLLSMLRRLPCLLLSGTDPIWPSSPSTATARILGVAAVESSEHLARRVTRLLHTASQMRG